MIQGKYYKYKKADHHKYGDGYSTRATPASFSDADCCKGSPGYRTDYSMTMQPIRGPRTYPSVVVITSATNQLYGGTMAGKYKKNKSGKMGESMGMGDGKASTKKSYKSHRKASTGMKKSGTSKKY